MALVRNDDNSGGKMNDFESTASFLIPNDPVLKKQASKDGYTISEINAETNDEGIVVNDNL